MNPFSPLRRLGSTVSRRDFLRLSGGCAALSSTSLLSSLLNLRMTHHAMAALPPGSITDYKAMVCVFLFGGNDSFQMLTPYDGTETTGEFGNYVTKRGGLHTAGTGGVALPQTELTQITAGGGPQAGRTFGVHHRMDAVTASHPSVQGIGQLYNAGKAAFVSNIGTLIDKTTRADYDAGVDLPKGLFSHSDEQRNWQTSLPHSRAAVKGWAGRIADCLAAASNSNPVISMNMSLGGNNILQSGDQVFPYIVDSNSGAIELTDYPANNNTFNRIRTNSLDAVLPTDETTLNALYADLLERTHAKNFRDAVDAAATFNAQISGAIPYDETMFHADFGSVGTQAKMVAKIINAREALQQKRQIFFITRGGFDNHDEVIANQESSLFQVAGAVSALYKACADMGVGNDVTIFTASDFSRTLNSNGNGTDHAWGANSLVVGGGVNADVWGQYPTDLTAAHDPSFAGNLDLGRGRLLPTTAVDEYAAELALWFGVPDDGELEAVLPNIRNFHSSGSGAPVGFLL